MRTLHPFEEGSSPFWTFELGAAGILLQTQKIPPNFPEADIPRCLICHGNLRLAHMSQQRRKHLFIGGMSSLGTGVDQPKDDIRSAVASEGNTNSLDGERTFSALALERSPNPQNQLSIVRLFGSTTSGAEQAVKEKVSRH